MQESLSTRSMDSSEEDLALFKACFDSNGSPRALAAYDWQYRKNPTGKLFVDFSIDRVDGQERVAAIYAVLPIWVRVFGQRVLAVQSLDTMTDSAYRGRGLFPKLAASVYARCESEGAAFVYGFPNGSSVHGFYTRLRWTSLDPVPFLIRPLRAGYAFQRLGLLKLGQVVSRLPVPVPSPQLAASEEIRMLEGFDEDVTALWKRFSRPVGIAVERDADYLTWRYRQKPGERYLTLGLFDHGQLVALAILTVKDKHGGRVGYLMELLHEPGGQSGGRRLVNAALAEMARQGADVALAWCLPHSPNRWCHRWAGFFELPTALRPIELHFGVRSLAGAAGGALGNPANWYISYSDSDTV